MIRLVNVGAVVHQMHFHGNHVWTVRRNGTDFPRAAGRVDAEGHAVLQQWEDVVELDQMDRKEIILPIRRPPEVPDRTWDARDEDWDYPVVFPPERPAVTLAQVIADRGLKQLHVAETEKYPHVTYFFNGGEEDEHEGETFALVPSPRDVPTYDHKPEMSAAGVTEAVVNAINSEQYALIVVNFANGDMVGHTGNLQAAIKACEYVDACIGQIFEAMEKHNGRAIVTADHGNAEQMFDPISNSPHTAHTTNPVPLVLTRPDVALRSGGELSDLAPTVLDLLGLEQPVQMTGASLVER